MTPEIGPKTFGTFEKQATGLTHIAVVRTTLVASQASEGYTLKAEYLVLVCLELLFGISLEDF